jgi:DNA-binding CsgD family transcriptional regulator
MGHPIRLTPEQKELFQTLWNDDKIILAEIGNRLGISKSAVKYQAEKLGFQPRAKAGITDEDRELVLALGRQKRTVQQIIDLTGITRWSVRTTLESLPGYEFGYHGRDNWGPEKIETLKREWSTRLTPSANSLRIAQMLKANPDTVLSRARALGLMASSENDAPIITADQCKRHAKACLAEGGFPAAHVVSGRAVWVWPLAPDNDIIPAGPAPKTMREICERVARKHVMTLEYFLTDTQRSTSQVRFEAMALMREAGGFSWPQMARFFAMNPSSCRVGVRTHNAKLAAERATTT